MTLHPSHATCHIRKSGPPREGATVTCDRCGRSYECTLLDDYYCDADSPDHVCEKCLVGGRELITIDPGLN